MTSELNKQIADNICRKIKKNIRIITKSRKGFKYETGYLGKTNCRYEVSLFGKDINIAQGNCEGISSNFMRDVFPDNNGFFLYSVTDNNSVLLKYKEIEDLFSVFNLAIDKLNQEKIECRFEINNNILSFIAIVPCNHYGIVI